MANIVSINKDNFESEVLKSDKLTLIDFWAPWCGPCKMVSPIIDELAEDYDGKVKFCKLNVDENPELSMQFRVMSIPTLIFFKDGDVVRREMGARGKEEFAQMIDSLL